MEADLFMKLAAEYESAAALARDLNVQGLALRNIIRKRKLVPDHIKHCRYRISRQLAQNIVAHPEVSALIKKAPAAR